MVKHCINKYSKLFLYCFTAFLFFHPLFLESAVSKKSIKKSLPKRSVPSSDSLIFQLDAMIAGPRVLYPGQRTELQYKISYNRSIDLTKSELPMMHSEHFIKIGEVKINDYQKGNLTVQELSQEIKASEIGRFKLGPSFIEGHSYTIKGQTKVYETSLLKAEAPPVDLEVIPFPEKNRPASFIDILGAIKTEIYLEQSNSVFIGDPLLLSITIQDALNRDDLKLPSIECQPGFPGFFQFPDVPPLSKTEGNKKTFFLEINPLTHWLQEIPPIEISSFDPLTHQYIVRTSQPIPFRLKPKEERSLTKENLEKRQQFPQEWPVIDMPSIELQNTFKIILHSPLGLRFFHYFMIGLLIILFIFMQYFLHRWWKKKQSQSLLSDQLFKEAMQAPIESYKQLHLIEEAFWTRLWEKGIIKKGVHQWEMVPEDKLLESVHSLLNQLQEWQYSQNKQINFPHWIKETRKLFYQLSLKHIKPAADHKEH